MLVGEQPASSGLGPDRLWCAAIALALAGCTVVPQRPAPELATPQAALLARAATMDGATGLSHAPVPAAWWMLFNDGTLSELQAEAAASNLDLQAAVARIEESRAQLGLARAAQAPQLAAEAGYARSAQSEYAPLARLGAPTTASSAWQLGLQAGWELDLWGHLRQLGVAADARLQASGYGAQAVRISVAGDIARTYLLLRGAQAQLALAGQQRAIAADLVRLAESRRRHGVATRFEAAAARAEVAVTDARRAQLKQQRDALMNALALLLGQAPRELDARLFDGAGPPPMPRELPIGVASELASQRPDILRADAQLRAALADIGAAEADFYPRIRLTGSLGLQASALSDLGDWGARRYSLGPSLYLPLFDGGRLQSQLALTQARHRTAAITYQQTVLNAWHEVDDALGAHVAERERHTQLTLAVAQQQAALDVARRAWQEGTADFTAVLVAQRTLIAGQAMLSECATAAALSVVALYRALGAGWSDALAEAPVRGKP
ncbi:MULTISPECIES: efflux transporter outer membrane subunit [Hydrogenophaga]